MPGAGAVVFEQAGYMHELDPKTGKSHVVNITATGDFPWMMPRWEDVTSRMTNLVALPHRQARARLKRAAKSSPSPPKKAISAT